MTGDRRPDPAATARSPRSTAPTPRREAVAIRDGRFCSPGPMPRSWRWPGRDASRSTLGGRRVIPGLIDSHMHIIRGGLNYNMELRWDGVRSLADAMAMLKRAGRRHAAAAMGARGRRLHRAPVRREAPADARRDQRRRAGHAGLHPAPLRPRAAERRRAARGRLHARTRRTRPGGEIQRDAAGNPTGPADRQAQRHASSTRRWPRGRSCRSEYQKNSTRHFMRELNRLGVTSVIDAGGGFQNYPDDYAVIEELHREGQLTVRIAYNLFTQKPKAGAGRLRRLGQAGRRPGRATISTATTAPARCWSSPPPTSRISA